MDTYSTYRSPERRPEIAPNLVRWGAVFAGTVIALGMFALISTLWVGIAYTYGDEGRGFFGDNIEWFLAGTAIAALFVAGLLAGYLSGVRGVAAGLTNGLTTWGLLFIASMFTIVPGLAAVTAGLTGTTEGAIGAIGPESGVWATFWSLLIGAVVAALGGVMGGAMKRDAQVADVDVRDMHDDDVRETRSDVRETRRDRDVRTSHDAYPNEPGAVSRTDADDPVVVRRTSVRDGDTRRH